MQQSPTLSDTSVFNKENENTALSNQSGIFVFCRQAIPILNKTFHQDFTINFNILPTRF